MRILFIANPHLKLYQDIVDELEINNHEVVVIEDERIKFDPYYCGPFFRMFIKAILFYVLNMSTRYWKKIIKNDNRLSNSYDILMALSGVSVNKFIISHLKTFNPNLRTILYTWDSCNYYNYSRLLSLFDKCYTFDINDSIKDKRWKLLPIYYKRQLDVISDKYKYDLFCVGTNHDGRYSFLEKIVPQLNSLKLNYYIKLVCDNDYKINEDKLGIKITKPISKEEYVENMRCSRCVLDDQREGQSGLTARFIWALANNKKIITTNKWVLQYSFVNPKQICIVDETTPFISLEFLRNEIRKEDCSNVSFLRIDNWVKELLS